MKLKKIAASCALACADEPNSAAKASAQAEEILFSFMESPEGCVG